MFIKTKTVKGRIYATLVRSYRKDGKILHEQILNFGVVEKDTLRYLKAAYSKNKPKLVYEDGTVYDPKAS